VIRLIARIKHMKIYLKLIVLFSCLLLHWQVEAQDARMRMTLLNEKDGMENSFVNDVIKDSRGLIWLATIGGVHCFDGHVFTVYNKSQDSQIRLTDNHVTSLAEGENGLIWVGTLDGLNIIDPAKRTVINYFNVGNTAYPPMGPAPFTCKVRKAGDGKIWINQGGKIASFFGDSLRYFDIGVDDEIVDIYTDQSEGLLVMFDDKVRPVIVSNSGLVTSLDTLPMIYAATIIQDNDGGLVMLSNNKKFYKFNLGKNSVKEYTPTAGSLAGMLLGFIDEFEQIDIPDSPIKENILFKTTKIFRDESGLVWVATNFGLVKLTYADYEFKKLKSLTGISLRGMYEAPSGNIYIAAYPPFSFFSYSPATDSVKQYGIEVVWPILPLNKDTLLLGQSGPGFKLFDLNKEEVVFSSSYKEVNNFHSLALGVNNKVWFGSTKGLYFSDKDDLSSLEPYTDPNGEEVFNRKIINNLKVDIKDKEKLWVSTNSGLYLISEQEGIVTSFFVNAEQENSILDNDVQQVAQDDDGDVWLATSGGLSYIDMKTGNTKNYTTREGLSDNSIFVMSKDNEGILWLGTRNGLSRFDPKEETFINFYEADGVAYREFNRGSALKTKSGLLYFGGLNGFSSFAPKSIKTEKTSFRPLISKYIIYDEDEKRRVEFLPASIEDDTKIRLSPRNRNIEFQLAITDYDRPKQAHFQVFLDGFDKEWVSLGNKRSFRYTNLDAGAYTFRVRAANKEGIWSDEEAKMTVIVQEPFLGGDLFFGIILLSIIGVLTAFYFSRLAYELAGFQLRNRIANDLHDEVSNTLNNIRIISAEAEQKGEVTTELARIKQMSVNAIEHVQDVIWAIDQDKESIKYLLFRIEDYIDILLRENKIPVTFTKEQLNPDNTLDFLHRRNLLLIFKEAISNMVKHAHCTRVVIEIGNKNNGFFMHCTNYFDKRKDHKFRSGRGIPSMEQRAEAIGGHLITEETDGKFVVSLKLKRTL